MVADRNGMQSSLALPLEGTITGTRALLDPLAFLKSCMEAAEETADGAVPTNNERHMLSPFLISSVNDLPRPRKLPPAAYGTMPAAGWLELAVERNEPPWLSIERVP